MKSSIDGKTKNMIQAYSRNIDVPKHKETKKSLIFTPYIWLIVLFALTFVATSYADEVSDEDMEEVIVVGSQNSQPHESVESVFGFEQSLLEIPRSASTISEEMLARFDMRDIDELIALAPGSFTQSFFGVAGSLDVRGTPGETYFRGVRRLDNPGNYPTPIGASDRIDIVRGPASPIYGPAKIGGYLNFVPKSARIEATDEIIDQIIGAISLSVGSWDKQIITAEVGGATTRGGKNLGYYLYSEFENSGSYYRNHGTDQTLIQTSFDVDLSANLHLEFGGMFHEFSGKQNAGWNRLTQDLIDHGIYITGQPHPLDTDGDGKISHQEFDVNGDGFTDLNPFAPGLVPGSPDELDTVTTGLCFIGQTPVFGCVLELLNLLNVGTTILDTSLVLTSPDDVLDNEVLTLYFDVIYQPSEIGWKWTNQIFFEMYDNLNENAYGFSQFHDSWVVENKLVGSRYWEREYSSIAVQISPSLRYTSFDHGDDYTNEYFDRRDLSVPGSSLDTRLLSTQIDDDYTEYYIGHYLDIGLAAMTNISWNNGVNLLAGIRYDSIDMESRQPIEKLLFASANNICVPPDLSCAHIAAENRYAGFSGTLSVNYYINPGFIPYATVSKQSTVIAGQGAELTTRNVADGRVWDSSTLYELGLKVSLLNNALYIASAFYEQERTDFLAQAIVTNQATRTRGTEFEMRWVVNEPLLITLGYSNMEIINLNTLAAGQRFSFVGAEDLPGIAPETFYGGSLVGTIVQSGIAGARRAGVPRTIASMTATYEFSPNFAISGSAVDVDSVHSGYSKSVKLPAYLLVNAGVVVNVGKWTLSATVKNLSDERYFRSNFPNLFGGVVVLPELPRHFQVRTQFQW
ncbi:MAG: TonB-dependent receptor [Gammaproteobacteria bacterium]|nr:TonB-dependent receptor [Gammaproteobacteria bacterium]